MSKSHRHEPPEFVAEDPDDDDEEAHEVIDVDYETFVYDDVDGHVVEPTSGNALPAPIRIDDDDDEEDDARDGPRRAIVSAGDTMPFAMSLDDQMADDAAGALLDRAVARQPKPFDATAVDATAVDETPGRPVTSAPTSAARDVGPRRTASAARTSSSSSKIERKLVAARTPSGTRAPLVARTEVEALTEVEPPMPAAERRSAAAAAAAVAPAAQKAGVDAPAERRADGRGVVCPFCAHVRADVDEACPRCTMADTASTRRSTGERIGPWFVLQRKNPTAPGLRFSVLLKLARRGHVTAKSIVRGPTTGQLWRYASGVKGLSRVFGTCWHCQADVSPDATTCPKCKSAQDIPDDPDVFIENHAVPLMTDESATPAPTSAPSPSAAAAPAAGVAVMREVEPMPPAEPRRAPPPPRPAPTIASPAPRPAKVAERPLASIEPARPIARIAANAGVKPTAAVNEPALSASELAAVFQLAPAVKPGRTRRVGRRVWRATKFVVAVAAVVAISGAAILYAKPEWREPTRAWATPIAQGARDRAIAAKAWTTHKSIDAWQATTAAVARWRAPAPTVDAPPTATSNDAPVAADDPPTPRVEDVAPPTPRIAEGRPSVVDATPEPAKPLPDRKTIAAQLDADQRTWESMMAARAATRPTANASANAANPPAAAANNSAAAASASASTDVRAGVAADERAAELARSASAAIADAERALAQTRAESTPRPAPPQQQQQPAPPPAAQPTTPAATARPPAAPTVTLDDAMSRAVTLRQKAFDAQAAGNWPGAVKLYEEIEKLPAEAQPSDLQVRLKLARDRARR